MSRPPLGVLAFAAFAVGFLLLFLFEHWVTRLLGVLALLAFIVTGVFAIATPSLLEEEDE
jgi:hypothetical protein